MSTSARLLSALFLVVALVASASAAKSIIIGLTPDFAFMAVDETRGAFRLVFNVSASMPSAAGASVLPSTLFAIDGCIGFLLQSYNQNSLQRYCFGDANMSWPYQAPPQNALAKAQSVFSMDSDLSAVVIANLPENHNFGAYSVLSASVFNYKTGAWQQAFKWATPSNINPGFPLLEWVYRESSQELVAYQIGAANWNLNQLYFVNGWSAVNADQMTLNFTYPTTPTVRMFGVDYDDLTQTLIGLGTNVNNARSSPLIVTFLAEDNTPTFDIIVDTGVPFQSYSYSASVLSSLRRLYFVAFSNFGSASLAVYNLDRSTKIAQLPLKTPLVGLVEIVV